jgi:hypothetical protein
MSSLVRRIQQKGERVGVTNPEAKDRLARLAREAKRKG